MLFLDDIRQPEDVLLYNTSSESTLYAGEDWQVVRNFDEFTKHIVENGLPDLISFDHDLGVDENGNELPSGYDCAKWLIDYIMDHSSPVPRILVSARPNAYFMRVV